MTRTEELLNALLEGKDVSDWVCESRMEHFLKMCCMGQECELMPKSRVEYLLKELSKKIAEGGGSSVDFFINEGDALSNLYFNQNYTFNNFFENLTYEDGECDLLNTDQSRIFAITDGTNYAIAEIPLLTMPSVGYVLHANAPIDLSTKYSWLKATEAGTPSNTRIIKGTVSSINPSFKEVMDYFVVKEKYLFGLYLENKSVIPSNEVQTIVPSENADGIKQVTVLTDADLLPENIKKDVQIFNVTGTYEGVGGSLKNLLDITKSCYGLFNEYKGETIPEGIIEYNDTSNVINMNNMYNSCYNLTTIPQLDTSKVTNIVCYVY